MNHSVSIVSGLASEPMELSEIISMTVAHDMLEVADQFSIEIPFSADAYKALAPDSEVQILIDDTRRLSGFIDARTRAVSRSGSTIMVSGRDKGGRLVDESAPLGSFLNSDLLTLARDMASPWFSDVALSNAVNRDLIRGRRARKARVSSEPAIATGKEVSLKVEPGESRINVLQRFLELADLLAWSAADGETFVVGKPNYAQEAQFAFFAPEENSGRRVEGNVLSFDHREDISERFSQITVCGSSNGDSANYGKNVTRRQGVAIDESGIFQQDKFLIIPDDDIRSRAQALARAQRELDLLSAAGETLTLECQGWGQALGGQAAKAFYSFDTVATWQDEEAGISGDWYITRVEISETKSEGQTSRLSLVPVGTELRIS